MLSNLPKDLYYLLLAILLLGAMFMLVPRRAMKNLFPSALVFGSLTSFIFVFVFGNILNLFYFSHYGAFHIYKIPFWVIMGWAPAIVIFLYFLPRNSGLIWFWVYILIFSAFSSGLGIILENLGVLHYIHWGPVYRLLVAIVWFYLSARYALPEKDTSS